MKFSKLSLSIIGIGLILSSCNNTSQKDINENYQTFEIKNSHGMVARFCNNGARLMSLLVPDKNGKLTDVVIGFDDPRDYDKATEPYFGATIGRFGNRIDKGKFSLEGKDYQLTINNGINTLHGGTTGFQYQKWSLNKNNDSTLVCTLVSPDGDNGFPGQLNVKVIYSLTKNNELSMEYEAETDKTTVVNLTNHAFFNLNGKGTILNHTLQINADHYLPIDSTLIPFGKPESVKNTPFDFTLAKAIGLNIDEKNDQLAYGKGYDHNFIINPNESKPVATVLGDQSGIEMKIYSKEPGLQFYSGNFMLSKNKMRHGLDDFRTAFCLETQHFPDSPNQPDYPSTVLKPGEIYKTKSLYAFSIKK